VPDAAIIQLPNGVFAENCYLVYDPAHADTVLVDPGEEPERFLAEARRLGRSISAVWITHAHIDHVCGTAEIRERTGAPVFLHPADRPLYDNTVHQGQLFGMRVLPPPPPDVELRHGQRLAVGGVEFEVRHVPGHSPGHVCFVGPGAVLGGDVLFEGSIGRTDLPGGDFDTLIAGIRRELLTLPDSTVVHPGHGPATTIGRERRSNPFLKDLPPSVPPAPRHPVADPRA
jgi:glyoxylase-like metal-dependent hydrolase (beta-lactamase superfamily II)